MAMTATAGTRNRPTSGVPATPQPSTPPSHAVSASALSDVDQRQRRPLLRYLTRRTGSSEEAEDILQDAYARVLAVVHPSEIDTLDRYLWRAAMNVMTDHGRARQRRTHLMERLAGQAEQFAPSAEIAADARERLALTSAAVTTLPPKCAQAFTLRIVQGLPFEAVGHSMHISARMAKIYVARTLRALQAELEGSRLPPRLPPGRVRRSPSRPSSRTQNYSTSAQPPRRNGTSDPLSLNTPYDRTQVQPTDCPSSGAAAIPPCARPANLPPTPPRPGTAVMQCPDAKAILKALIEGCEPGSREPLPTGSVVHRADVLRALLAGVAALEQVDTRARRRAALPGNAGRAWSAEEDARLAEAFSAGESPNGLAAKHHRTLRAIEARLQRMGLLDPEARTTREGFGSEP